VRLLGTVTALRGDTASIICGSHGEVTLILKPDSHLQMGKLVEVVGKVAEVPEGGLGVKVLATTDWGNPADCGMWLSLSLSILILVWGFCGEVGGRRDSMADWVTQITRSTRSLWR
jgi:hypothetical protein